MRTKCERLAVREIGFSDHALTDGFVLGEIFSGHDTARWGNPNSPGINAGNGTAQLGHPTRPVIAHDTRVTFETVKIVSDINLLYEGANFLHRCVVLQPIPNHRSEPFSPKLVIFANYFIRQFGQRLA